MDQKSKIGPDNPMNPSISFLETVLSFIHNDFCDDEEDMQGGTRVDFRDGMLTLTYLPFPTSPYPAVTERYQVTRISD